MNAFQINICCAVLCLHLNNGYQSRFLLKGDFSIVVYSSLLLSLLANVNSCCSQLSALL